MSVLNQKTINKDVTFKGVGLHSGLDVTMTIKPAEPNSGIIFKRIDLAKNNIIIPNVFNVSSAVFCTTVSNDQGTKVSTIEHLMGALYGMGIDNVLIEIDNEEVPILDGSAKIFVEKIKDVSDFCHNDFESVLLSKYLFLKPIFEELRDCFGLSFQVSGSGSSCFCFVSESVDERPVRDFISRSLGLEASFWVSRIRLN